MQDLVFYYPENHEKHFEPSHPERPDRITAIVESLTAAGLWEKYPKLESAQVSDNVLHAIHDPHYLNTLKDTIEKGQRLDADTYITRASWDIATATVGGAVAVAEAVYTREAKRGFALCRPPGHHATPNQAMGFCLINNIAAAAEHLLQNHGAERISIIDIDLHHGNGTQDIFFERGDVQFFSIHQYPLYPFSGFVDETGLGPGKESTINIPFSLQAGDQARQAAIDEIILPLLDRFKPNMLLISAGFDAHWKDPLGHQLTTTKGYGNFMHQITQWADNNCEGRIALILEGGYDLAAGATSATAAVEAMLGPNWNTSLGPSPEPENDRWQRVIQEVKQVWGL